MISAYQKCVAETVGRLGGFIAKFMGDGVLIYFGYPQAHEDDAERAVRAGLEKSCCGAGRRQRRARVKWSCCPARLWGKAGLRLIERSALVEEVEQLTRALSLMETLPPNPGLRREQIKLQVALITPLVHVKGYAAPETKAATEQARLLIERTEGLGETPDDPLSLLSVLYSFWVANLVAFDGDVVRRLAAEFLGFAERQDSIVAVMMGHRIMGMTLLCLGEIAEGLPHLDMALALYDPSEHRPLANRFGQDVRMAILSYRALARWVLGYPDAALSDTRSAFPWFESYQATSASL